jgi:hypothetical protein
MDGIRPGYAAGDRTQHQLAATGIAEHVLTALPRSIMACCTVRAY